MDEMRIKIATKFMKSIVSKVISKIIFKNFRVRPNIHIEELEAEMKDGKIHFRINANGEVDSNILVKINRILDDE